MPTYVLLSKLTDHGAKTVKENPDRIKEVNREIEALGAKVVHQYATLGRYDFVNVVEAKDAAAIARVGLELAARGTIRIETLTAIPAEELIGRLRG